MMTLARNEREFCFCLYKGLAHRTDEFGNEVSEATPLYDEPVYAYGNISPATGQSSTEQFGTLDNYDKVIVMDDVDTPIDETAVLFVDKSYSLNDDGIPMYDYIVRAVAKSLNSVSIAIKKVDVS